MTRDTVRRGEDRRTVGQGWATVRRLAVACLCLFVAVTVCSAPALASDDRNDGRNRVTAAVSPAGHGAVAGPDGAVPVRARHDGTAATDSRKVPAVSDAQRDGASTDDTLGVADAASLVCGAHAPAADAAQDELSAATLASAADEKPANGGADGARATDGQQRPPRGLAVEHERASVDAGERASVDAVERANVDIGDQPAAGPAVAPDATDGSGQPLDAVLVVSVLANGFLGVLVVRQEEMGAFSTVRGTLREVVTGGPFAGPTDGSAGGLDNGGGVQADRETIVDLLAASDGRLYQSEIVERTGLSKATVSRRLAELDAAGEVVKIRLGRQNLVCLDGAEPAIARPRE